MPGIQRSPGETEHRDPLRGVLGLSRPRGDEKGKNQGEPSESGHEFRAPQGKKGKGTGSAGRAKAAGAPGAKGATRTESAPGTAGATSAPREPGAARAPSAP